MANPKSRTKVKRDAKGHFVATAKKSKEKELRDRVARLHALLSVEEKRSERAEQTAKELESVRAELHQVKRNSLKYRNFAFHPITGEPFQKLFWQSQYAFRCALDDWKKESKQYKLRDSEHSHEIESNRETIKNLQKLLTDETAQHKADCRISRRRLVNMIILASGLVFLAAYVLLH